MNKKDKYNLYKEINNKKEEYRLNLLRFKSPFNERLYNYYCYLEAIMRRGPGFAVNGVESYYYEESIKLREDIKRKYFNAELIEVRLDQLVEYGYKI